MGSVKIEFSEAAGVSVSNKNQNYPVSEKFNPNIDDYDCLAIRIDKPPETILFNNIVRAMFHFYGTQWLESSQSNTALTLDRIVKDFDTENATYNSLVREDGSARLVYKSDFPGWIEYTNFSGIITRIFGFLIKFPKFEFYTPYGANVPYVLIEYDDNPSGLEAAEISPSDSFAQCIDQNITWQLKTSANIFGELKAVSSILEWRENESGAISSISSNDNESVLIPAGTFTGDRVQVRVCVTSNSGARTESSWVSLTLIPPQIDSPSPASGFVPKYADSVFSWSLVYENEDETKAQVTQVNATFRWRERDGAQEHEVFVDSAEPRVKIPGGTFTSDSIQWMVSCTAIGGVTVSSGWFTCTTVDSVSSARAISPKTIVIQSGADIQFVWEHIVETGAAPTGFDIQYSTDKLMWHDLLTGKTSETTALLENNTLPGGTVYWRVRTYNADAVAGEWSEPAEIIVIAPPDAPVIVLDQISPQPIIRWIAQGQISYELEIENAESVSRYGNENRYKAKTVLSDGLHTVRVRIQNSYSLWSKWAEASFTVFNSPGAEITLTATPDSMGNVSLSWSVAGLFDRYEVLRDGTVIARTATTSFTDHLAIGGVQYQVRGIVDEAGNYSLSNAVEQTVAVRYVQIAPVSGGEWLALPYSTTDIREVSTNVSRAVTYQQYTGAKLPTATVSEALTVSHQIAAAFPWSQKAAADRLEAMIGQLVCVKDPRGERFVGVLGNYSKTSSRFYVAYSLTITPVDWEEVAT